MPAPTVGVAAGDDQGDAAHPPPPAPPQRCCGAEVANESPYGSWLLLAAPNRARMSKRNLRFIVVFNI